MEDEKKQNVFKWYEMDVYDSEIPEGKKGKIQENLEETYSVLFNTLKTMAENLGIEAAEKLDLQIALKECQENDIPLKDYLDSVFGNYTLDSFAVGMGTAKRYLNENGVTPVWLEECGQYYGEYKINDITYRIWLEEHESLKLKLDVMGEYNLGGVACWKLGLEINDVWPIIDEYVNQ